jgi:hypothetical protein
MSKDNRFVPPAIKRDSRPNNSVVPHRRRKRSNAQRHGVFAEPLILPGEDPGEFEALHAALIAEWTPSGPSEESKVFSIADAEWRKLRSRRFAEAKAISNSMRPDHPAFDEARGLIHPYMPRTRDRFRRTGEQTPPRRYNPLSEPKISATEF